MPLVGKNHWGARNDIILEHVDVGGANMSFMYLNLYYVCSDEKFAYLIAVRLPLI